MFFLLVGISIGRITFAVFFFHFFLCVLLFLSRLGHSLDVRCALDDNLPL